MSSLVFLPAALCWWAKKIKKIIIIIARPIPDWEGDSPAHTPTRTVHVIVADFLMFRRLYD